MAIMGISRLTALQIQNNPKIKCEAAGPNGKGKYMGWISWYTPTRWHPLLSSEQIYDSEEAAVQAMQAIVDEINRWPLDDILGKFSPETSKEPQMNSYEFHNDEEKEMLNMPPGASGQKDYPGLY
jgi:hypothetical protein